VLYLANPTVGTRDAMTSGRLGAMVTPRQGNRIDAGWTWAADNGCFSNPDAFDLDAYLTWLDRMAPIRPWCLFATAPDRVGDAATTLALSGPVLPKLRAIGYPAALVGQDGLEDLTVPWDDFDVLFLGGSTDWKLGLAAAELARAALARGKRLHMGRVNSARRYRYAKALGCHSADGTYLTFGPDVNLPRLHGWHSQPVQETLL
jgi:hypothetical protein